MTLFNNGRVLTMEDLHSIPTHIPVGDTLLVRGSGYQFRHKPAQFRHTQLKNIRINSVWQDSVYFGLKNVR